MLKNKAKFAHIVTLFSLIGISFSAPLGSLAIKSGAAPMLVGIYRMAFSIPMMASVWMFSGIKKSKNAKTEITPRHKAVNVLSGVFLAFHFICWYYALANTTVFSAAALVSLQPIFAMMGAYIVFRQKPSRSIALPLCIAIAGSIILVSPSAGQGTGTLLGNIMAASASLFMAAYLMCGRYSMQRISLGGYATVAYGVCFAVMAAALFLTGGSFLAEAKILLICLALSFSATLFGHTLINWSLPYVGAFFVTVVLLGEPVGASVVAFFMFGTLPGWLELIGGIMIILGIAVMVIRENRAVKQRLPQS